MKRVLIIFFIVLFEIVVVLISKRNVVNENKKVIGLIAESVGASLPLNELDSIPVKIEDLQQYNGEGLRAIMKQIVSINKEARSAYIYVLRENRIFFMADSEPESSKDYCPTGVEYVEATEEDREIFKNGKTFIVTDPIVDRWGEWVSVSVPLKNKENGEVIAVFGMDYDAKNWWKEILFEVVEHAALVVLVIALVFISVFGYTKNVELKSEMLLRELAEKEIEISSERLRLAFENSGDGLWGWHITKGELYFSFQFCVIIGWHDHKFSKGIKELLHLIHPKDIKGVMYEYSCFVNGKSDQFFIEFQIRTQNGQYKWVHLRSKAVEYNEKCKPVHISGIMTDIDARKRSEITLSVSLKREQELNEMKSKFVSMASHEFRTPLSSILLAAETLQSYNGRMSQDSVDQKIKRIQNNVIFLSSIIEKVLNLTHIESGNLKLVPTVFHLPNLIISIIDDFRASTDEHNLIDFNFEDNECVIYADKQLLNQSISNLISNSIKYSPRGSTINIELFKEQDNIVICISDRGIGISSEDAVRIFEPFFRGSNTGNIRGTGLGLSLTHQFIQLHKGELTFYSNQYGGTTFCIKIPQNKISENPNSQD